MKRLSLPNYVLRTGAKYESTEAFLKSSSLVDSRQDDLKSAGIPLTSISENTYATSTDELHCFIIGDSGCGKTRRIILPSINLMSKTGQSMVISDPKGEIYRATASTLKNAGYSIFVLNFRNPSRGSRWNPLSMIENMYRSEDQELKDRSVLMLKDIVDIIKKEGESEKDRFWENSASKVFIGIALLILEYGKKGDLTFENISVAAMDIFSDLAKNGRSRNPEFSSKEQVNLVSFLAELPRNSPIVQNLSAITSVERETRNSIIGVFENMVAVYTNQASLQDLFSESEIDINQLGMKPTALFFILPDDSGALYPIATVFVKQIYSTLVNLADTNRSNKLDNQVTFLLDEFANFAPIPSFDSMLTAARSRKIRFVLVCQSMEQLNLKYKDEGAEIILTNCRLWIYMSCRNLPFLERLSRLVGDYISPYTGERYPLISISELQHFNIGQVLVLNDRCRPKMGYLPDISKYDFGEKSTSEVTELPEKRAFVERSYIDIMAKLDDAMLVIKAIKAEKNSQDKSLDALRDEINELINVQRTPKRNFFPGQKMRPFEQFSRDEIREEEAKGQTDPIIFLFKKGEYEVAARSLIARIESGEVEDIPRLAFIIRFGKIDTNRLKAKFSLSVFNLLDDYSVMEDPFSYVNMALFQTELEHFSEAIGIFKSLSSDDWKKVWPFWYVNVWKLKDKHPEGALVSIIAERCCRLNLDDCDTLLSVAEQAYPNLFSDEQFISLLIPRTEEEIAEADKSKFRISAQTGLDFTIKDVIESIEEELSKRQETTPQDQTSDKPLVDPTSEDNDDDEDED